MADYNREFRHLDPLTGFNHKVGGLSFTTPDFIKEPFLLEIPPRTITPPDTTVIRDIGKTCTIELAKVPRSPIKVEEVVVDNCHQKLKDNLVIGVMDMMIKKEGESEVVLPGELESITPVLQEMFAFEQATNPNYLDWNAWLLVDIRSTMKDHTQRNAGWHYDGLNIGGNYVNMPVVSIYAWATRIKTRFYTGKVTFPEHFKPCQNGNLVLQTQLKDDSDLLDADLNTVYKFDGCTPHTGVEADQDVLDRVFIRLCFTPPDLYFNRKGNTPNPFIEYPLDYSWRSICDPSITFENLITYNCPEEFVNIWDICCQGHAAYSVRHEGKKALQYELIVHLKKNHGRQFVKKVCQIYQSRNNLVSKIRKEILKICFDL